MLPRNRTLQRLDSGEMADRMGSSTECLCVRGVVRPCEGLWGENREGKDANEGWIELENRVRSLKGDSRPGKCGPVFH